MCPDARSTHACIFLCCHDDAVSPPDIIIGGGENPVPQGDPVSLVCLPISGEPGPTVRWTGALPPGAQVTNDPATGTTITVPSVNQDFCVDCIGTNQAGQITKTKCVTVRGKISSWYCYRSRQIQTTYT